MDNDNNNTNAHSPQKLGHQNHNFNRERGKPQRSFNDLREVLNKKRQGKDESNGPPSEPKYNFLSDPLRDGEEQSKQDQYGSGRFTPRNNYDYRDRGRGRGRGRGYYQSNNKYRQVYKRDDDIKADSANGESSEVHNYEDRNKHEHVGKEDHSKYRAYSQSRPFAHRRKFDHGNKFENSGQEFPQSEAAENSQRQEERISGNYIPRRNFPNRGAQYYRPPLRSNPRFRGNQYKRNSKSLDPVNIKVEYSVDSGRRKCMIERKDVTKEEKHLQEGEKCAAVECEENWDEDADSDNEPRNEVVDEIEISKETKKIEEKIEENNDVEEEKEDPNKAKNEEINDKENKREPTKSKETDEK